MLIALQQLAQEHDELTIAVKGFERYMRRTGVTDETIRESLDTVREYIGTILDDASSSSDAATA